MKTVKAFKLIHILALLTALLLCCACAKGTAVPQETAAAQTEAPATTASPAPSAAAISAPTAVPAAAGSDTAVSGGAADFFFINSGKSDAILIRTAEGAYLVDTGLEESAVQVFAALNTLGIEKLDAIFLTHTHSDHIGGLDTLLTEIPVTTVYRAAISENKKDGSNAIDNIASDHDMTPVRLLSGEVIPLGGGVTATVIGPLSYNGDDDNDNSLVLLIDTGTARCLLTGDMQFAEEQELINSGTDLSADILKIGNHGNPDATSNAFAYAVDPAVCVFTTDRLVDDDSANERVLDLFPASTVYITDETVRGVLLSVSADGAITESDPVTESVLSLAIGNVNMDENTLTITNTGTEAADLSYAMLVTDKNGAFLRIPEGTILPAGESLTVSGSKGNGDLLFPVKKPLSGKGFSGVYLYDAYGNLLSAWKN